MIFISFPFLKKQLFKIILLLLLLIIFVFVKNKDIFVKIIIDYIFNNKLYNSPFLKSKFNNSFFFEENQEELNYCNHYGLFVYDYYYENKIKFANIGDYIQSLAALQYLPKNCKPYLIDRDHIQFYHGPKVKLIMNGWFILHKGNIEISEQIDPIFVSYHLFNDKQLPSDYLKSIKKFTPIGCRDKNTRDTLIKLGINAYFSSCLTTTLDLDYFSSGDKRTNEIIFIDYKFGDYPKADKFLYSLSAYNFNNITHTNHLFNISMTHLERFKLAKSLLDKYSKAKLVVSTRIHGALPCLSFQTPVIFVNKKYDYKRYNGIYDLLNTIGINIENKFKIRININEKGLVYNSNEYIKYSKELKMKLGRI